ncbi:MAG: GspE/PulE family protein [Patescibacteria group bacterium]
MTNASPQKAPSIEDLLKKARAAQAASKPQKATGYIKGATPVKTSSDASDKLRDETKEAKLSEKMSEIKLIELERRAEKQAAELNLPYINLKAFPIAPEILSLIPREQAEKDRVLPFLKHEDEIRIATTQPGAKIDAIAEKLAKEQSANIQIYLVSETSLLNALKLYAAIPETKEVIYGVRIEEEDLKRWEKEITSFRDLQEKITTVSVTDVVTLMIGAALKSKASDVHVEAEEKDIKLRFRIDGILHDVAKLQKSLWKQMISRLKLVAGAKINIASIPQDGRITIYLGEEKIEIRVSFLPTAFGESVVMRILRPTAISLEFEKLGIRGKAYEQIKREIQRPNGMIITTGPTGSGKTTTLYAILNKLNTPNVKIITLEDPVEYKLEGINQSQIDHEKKYDFARGLRSILRQDPDVVMVGEIRDLETADISIQAALTGHLVVSTVHTNSAAAAIPRFLSMGAKPFLLAPAINAIIGQRLVRRLCENCKKRIEPSASVMAEVKQALKAIPENSGYTVDFSKLEFYGPPEDGPKCETCDGLGYKGRLGIYEVMVMTKEIENLILTGNVSEYQMAEVASKQGMVTMVQDGLLKALDGLSSVEEILRVAEIQTVAEDVPEGELPPSRQEVPEQEALTKE